MYLPVRRSYHNTRPRPHGASVVADNVHRVVGVRTAHDTHVRAHNGHRITGLGWVHQFQYHRIWKAPGQPRLWEAFIIIDTSPTADVICRAVKAMKEEAQTDDAR